MLFRSIWIPEKDEVPSTREEFDTWVDRLSQVVPGGHAKVFMKGSEETATLLEKAHPETVVCLVRVDSLASFWSTKYTELLRKEMAFIQGHLSSGGIAVFEPYRKYIFDGMRFTPKEVK